MSFTPEALYIIGSCDEQDNKKIFMSSPACADGYDTPAQQREDSTTFMVAKVSWTGAGRPGPDGRRGGPGPMAALDSEHNHPTRSSISQGRPEKYR